MSVTSSRMKGEENNNSYILLVALSCHHHWSDEEFIPSKILGLWVSSGTCFASKMLWGKMPGDVFWRKQKIVITAGTNGLADGKVGDEKRELGKMGQGCVVMKSLKMWEKEKLVEREGESSWGFLLLRIEVLALVCFKVFSKSSLLNWVACRYRTSQFIQVQLRTVTTWLTFPGGGNLTWLRVFFLFMPCMIVGIWMQDALSFLKESEAMYFIF